MIVNQHKVIPKIICNDNEPRFSLYFYNSNIFNIKNHVPKLPNKWKLYPTNIISFILIHNIEKTLRSANTTFAHDPMTKSGIFPSSTVDTSSVIGL